MRKLAIALTMLASLSAAAQTMPPWSKGANDPAADKGLIFEVPDVDNVPDLHGNPQDAKLVLFIGGNQFFVLPGLIRGFERQHPELAGHIFYETLPPGILQQQMQHGNTVTLGNFTLHVVPDVYEAGANTLDEMQSKGIVTRSVRYTTNDLMIMVAAGNPKHVTGLADLARPGLRIAMPNAATEGVAKQIQASLRKAGGDALEQTVYERNVKSGSTYLTQIHHRQTPMRILEGRSDAGVVWSSEVRFQQSLGNPLAGIPIPAEQNTNATYAAGIVRGAPHAEAADAWLAYLQSAEAQQIYSRFGFRPLTKAAK